MGVRKERGMDGAGKTQRYTEGYMGVTCDVKYLVQSNKSSSYVYYSTKKKKDMSAVRSEKSSKLLL